MPLKKTASCGLVRTPTIITDKRWLPGAIQSHPYDGLTKRLTFLAVPPLSYTGFAAYYAFARAVRRAYPNLGCACPRRAVSAGGHGRATTGLAWSMLALLAIDLARLHLLFALTPLWSMAVGVAEAFGLWLSADASVLRTSGCYWGRLALYWSVCMRH